MNFIITSPLYYVNDKPHLGSVYTTIICDSIARYKRLRGKKVVFITGVDEHGLKIQRTALSNEVSPKEHCDAISDVFKKNWIKWNISFNKFIRTTSHEHEKVVHEFYEKVKASNDIYMGEQKGWYCVGCEEFKDNPDNSPSYKCPIHKKNLEWKNEKNLFFRLSKYQEAIEELIQDPNFIEPKERRNEIINFVSKGLKDFSISRTNLDWGIRVPDHLNHTFYVWFDALLGYVSAISSGEKNHSLDLSIKSGWPANLHIIGKDILRFHSIYWPAMLISAGIEPPQKIMAHGFLTREGQKMGKSLGNVLNPEKLLSKYGEESVRWYLLKDINLGSDGDFQDRRFVDIINNDLANTIGNLLNRTTSMSRKWFNDQTPSDVETNNDEIIELVNNSIKKYLNHFDSYKIDKASNEILYLATNVNLYLNKKEPWSLIKDDKNINEVKLIIYNVLEATRIIGALIKPILPKLSIKILNQLGENDIENENWEENLKWGLLPESRDLPKPNPIINKLDYE